MADLFTIGLLSGTSADAIDGALVRWHDDQPQLIASHNLAIPSDLKTKVVSLAKSQAQEIELIYELDYRYAQLFAQAALKVCQLAGVQTEDIAAIGSHGQTIRHYPPREQSSNQSRPGFSLQIGDPNIIAEMTGITTIADFRRRDIAAGGHGAPLAPGLHKALFHSSTIDRIILNTGGIANITLLPQSGTVIGFDTGPANGLLDSWCQLHTGKSYDDGGQWARQGQCITSLLNKLLEHPFLRQKPPKSTGREDFNLPWLEQQLAQFEPFKPVDIQATLLAYTVETIAAAIDELSLLQRFEVYICGGGAHNHFFVEQLETRLNQLQQRATVANTSALGLDPDWVEAVCFAWLAKRRLEGKSGNLPAVTGASKSVVLGGIYPA